MWNSTVAYIAPNIRFHFPVILNPNKETTLSILQRLYGHSQLVERKNNKILSLKFYWIDLPQLWVKLLENRVDTTQTEL